MSSDFKTLHPQYEASVFIWRMVRDFVAGSAQVKRRNTLYLPMPSAMSTVTVAPDASTEQRQRQPKDIGGFVPSTVNNSDKSRINQEVPWYYPTNLAYESYLRRARVPDLTSFALRGLLGIATRKPPTIELPKKLEYLLDNATPDGFGLEEMFVFMVSQILQVGRIGIMLDVTNDRKFKFNLYSADACINWKEKIESGNRKLNLVVLQEDETADPDNCYSHEAKAKYIVLSLDKDSGIYVAETYKDDSEDDSPYDEKIPSIFGKSLKHIPFIFAGSLDITPDVDRSLLQGVADISQHIYMKEADLANAEFMTCNPTLVMTGVEGDDSPFATGSNVAIALSAPDAKVYYTQTDTAGLSHVMEHIDKMNEEAAAFGATLLGARKRGVESAESVRLQQSVGGATLSSAVKSAGDAIQTLLEVAANWAGITGDVVFEPSTEFSDSPIDHNILTALLKSYMQGTMSLETLIENYRRSGLLQDGDGIQDELEKINASLFSAEDDIEEEERKPEIEDDEIEDDES